MCEVVGLRRVSVVDFGFGRAVDVDVDVAFPSDLTFVVDESLCSGLDTRVCHKSSFSLF